MATMVDHFGDPYEETTMTTFEELRQRLMCEASPSPGSFKAEPLTPEQIDAHPDSDRIWATIQVMRGTR